MGGKKQTIKCRLSIYRVGIMENPFSEIESLILIVDDWRHGWLEDVECRSSCHFLAILADSLGADLLGRIRLGSRYLVARG